MKKLLLTLALLVCALPARAAVAIVAHASAGAAVSGTDVVIAGVNCTGANFVIFIVTDFNANTAGFTITDTSSNSYSGTTSTIGNTGATNLTGYYATSASVSSSMTFTAHSASESLTSAVVYCFSGAATSSPIDSQSGAYWGVAGGSGTWGGSGQPGVVTPSLTDALIVVMGSNPTGGFSAMASATGYTVDENVTKNGQHLAVGSASLISSSSQNPTVTDNGGSPSQPSIISIAIKPPGAPTANTAPAMVL